VDIQIEFKKLLERVREVPSEEEIAFVLEIIDNIGQPALQLVNSLVEVGGNWDTVSRNDFCRSLCFPPPVFL
jgi:proteasome activator subunit 4